MDELEKQKTQEVATESTETPIHWDLTEEDRLFLKSCNIATE